MSENLSRRDQQYYLQKLMEHSRPESNDERHRQYVKNLNKFLSYFGKEQAHLVGSTGEQLKLRSAKDGGDADFLLCSGKLEIPVENLEFRKDTPCFVWIKAAEMESVLKEVDLIDGKYLPSKKLREVGPELFTILRGIFKVVTTTEDNIPGRVSRVTTTGEDSKVGLARTEYRNLKIDISPEVMNANKTVARGRSLERKKKLHMRRKEVLFNRTDMETLNNVLDVIALCKKDENKGANKAQLQKDETKGAKEGKLQRFGRILDQVLKCLNDKDAGICVPGASHDDSSDQYFSNDLDLEDENDQQIPAKSRKIGHEPTTLPEQVTATYSSKTSKDFVPALRVVGKLQCMEEWKLRTHTWLGEETVEEIYNMDVYVVSKYTPKDPNIDKDFCLSFNLAEIKLAESLSTVQKSILLILKSYLKGMIANEHKSANEHKREQLKLTTFHLKTALYWVIEKTDATFWADTNVVDAIRKVVEFLVEAIQKKELLHFFVPSNLFAGFSDEDFQFLLHCMGKINEDPIESIKYFFEMEDGPPVKITFEREELLDFIGLRVDGGESGEADAIQDAIIDFQRGFNDGPRNAERISPINEAILETVRLFIEDEAQRKLTEQIQKINVPSEYSNLLSAFMPSIAKCVVNSDPGKELFSMLKTYLNCSSLHREEKDQRLKSLKDKAEKYFQ